MPCDRLHSFVPFVMIFHNDFVDSEDVHNERIRNGSIVVRSQESGCKPALITTRLSSHKLGTLLKARHNLGYRPGRDRSPVDDLWLRKPLPTSHLH
jgi:hypothetical protein